MVDASIPTDEPVIYKTRLATIGTWVSGTFVQFVTPGRTHATASLIVDPTDNRAIAAHHRRGAVVAQAVYAVPLDFIMGRLTRTEALAVLLKSPDHPLREDHIAEILDNTESIVENYVVLL